MIRSLRKKFIWINMALVFVILVVVFSVICISGCQNALRQSMMALDKVLGRYDEERPPSVEIGKTPPEDFIKTASFVLWIQPDGTPALLSSDSITVSEEQMAELAEIVGGSGTREGIVKQYNLRYKVDDRHGKTRVAFVEISGERAEISRTILLSGLALIVSLLAFFAASLFLSNWALRPVVRSWEQQKRFVADASHELKTPLTVVLANMEIMKKDADLDSESAAKWVDSTETEALRMKNLVDDMLFLAKSDDVEDRTVFGDVNLSDVVAGAALSLEALAYEKGLEIQTDGVERNIRIDGDRRQLEQLVTVLLDNAIKYSDEQSTVHVRLRRSQEEIALSVQNAGVIDGEDLGHLFERFYRASKSRSDAGYGLGLSIAEKIADAHQGKISVASDVKNGTVFTVTLRAK